MINELEKISLIKKDEDLTNYNTYRLNSMCSVMVFPSSMDELISVINVIKKYKSKWFVIGNGSNIILPSYYDGVIIKLNNFNKCFITNDEVYVESGYMINKLAMELVEKGYSGFEWATGIPGTIGGSVYNNAGAYNSAISDVLISCNVFDGENVIEFSNNELCFEYRDSLFKKNKNLVILSCRFKIIKGDKSELKKLVFERTNKRIETQDLEHPSCGSVFRNPPNTAAGKLIDDLGLKGYSIGGAKVSLKHANFIINDKDATSEDIIKLIDKVKTDVKNNYDINLVLEQEIIK